MKRARTPSIAVVYLARGYDRDHLDRFERFLDSYREFPAGLDHKLYVIFKGFRSPRSLATGKAFFAKVPHQAAYTGDDHFDLGAYAETTASIGEDVVCYFNTNAEIVSANWLLKLVSNLNQPYIGAVAATGSFESLYGLSTRFLPYPNPHLRSNAISMWRDDALEIFSSIPIKGKMDAFMLESGPGGITRQIMNRGLSPLVVGADGRGYSAEWWAFSGTFRQGTQANLLVHDNVTRLYDEAPVERKNYFATLSWSPSRPRLLSALTRE